MSKETRSFQAETKQLLDLMIHSIYTHKEIFLRELISNASDAIDKIKFESLTNTDMLEGDSDFKITVKADKNNRTVTISDNGIGMTYDEVVNHIGTIAKSGSKMFAQKLKEQKEGDKSVDLIGQFGVGFYSAFMVAEKVVLVTKAPFQNEGVRWESIGDGTYSIENFPKEKRGTEITLYLREDKKETEDEHEHEQDFTSEYVIESLIKKYSDYIRYPIYVEKEQTEEKTEEEKDEKSVNSMIPIWKKDKKDVTAEEYNEFYKSRFHDWTDPFEVIHSKAEGSNIEYTMLLFIPSKAPFDFYSKDFHKGIQLYSKNVFIMENCPELIPDYFRFVKGLVDSPDFSLNISREILQHDRQLKFISKNIEKKIVGTLKDMLEKDRKKYEEFWKEFGEAIKSGVYSSFGKNDSLKELLVFSSSNSENMITLDEYTARMKENQKYIYYAVGENKNNIEKLPQMESLKDKGFEVLYFYDRIDEFTIESMRNYKDKEFKSITRGELDLGDNTEDKSKIEKLNEENKTLLEKIKEILKEKVSDVKLTGRLKTSAVCLVSDSKGISIGMEKIMADLPQMKGLKAERILELNPEHAVFKALKTIYERDGETEDLKEFSEILYSQALLIEGLSLEDPVEFANKMSNLIVKAVK